MEYVHVYCHPESLETAMLPPPPQDPPPLPFRWSGLVGTIKRDPLILLNPLKPLIILFFCLLKKKRYI